MEAKQAAVKELETLLDKAKTENRDLNEAEVAKFDELTQRAEALAKDIERRERVFNLSGGQQHTQPEPQRQPGRDDVDPAKGKAFEERDLRGYSLLRAINKLTRNEPLDGLEREVSDEIAKRNGKQPTGFYFPNEIAFEARALDKAAGAGAIATDLQTGSFIDMLRSKTVLQTLGARFLTGLVGDLAIPKQTGGATAYWLNEGSSPTGSAPTIGQVALTPRTVGAYVDLTRKFILQSSISAEQFVRQDLALVLAGAIDKAAINGSGVGAEPLGLLQMSGVPTLPIGTNGGALTFANAVALESIIAAANADADTMAYLTNPKVRGAAKVTAKAVGIPEMFWDEDSINGYRAVCSNLMPSTLTKGTGTALSAAIFGNWADLIVGFWSAVDITVDPYSLSTSGGVRIVALQDVDVAVRHPESFAKIVDITTV